MKTRHFLTAACIAALGLTACNNDDEGNNLREEVKIVTSINGTSNAPQSRAAIDPATGAGNLESGDVITLIYGETSGSIKTSTTYTVGTTNLYWDEVVSGAGSTATAYGFAAFYPKDVATTSANWNAATEANPDLLFATATGVAVKGAVNLVFSHIMHKMVVNLSSNIYSTNQLAAAKVTPQGLKSTATVDYGVINPDVTTGTDAYPTLTGASTAHIVAPQNSTAGGLTPGGDLLKIEIAGDTFYYKVPSTLTALESGKQLTLNLSITRDAVILTGQNVTGWGTQDTVTDEIKFDD